MWQTALATIAPSGPAGYLPTAVHAFQVPLLPGGKPLIGHAVEILTNQHRFHDWILEGCRAQGYKTYAFTVPLQPTWFVVTDPTCLEYVLRTEMHNFVKGSTVRRNYGPLLGHGIFTSDGEQWLWQRKLATHIFTVKRCGMHTALAVLAGGILCWCASCSTVVQMPATYSSSAGAMCAPVCFYSSWRSIAGGIAWTTVSTRHHVAVTENGPLLPPALGSAGNNVALCRAQHGYQQHLLTQQGLQPQPAGATAGSSLCGSSFTSCQHSIACLLLVSLPLSPCRIACLLQLQTLH